MATLQELRSLFTHSDLLEKVESAVIIAVQDILDGTPTLSDKRYAAHVFASPRTEATKALMSVLAANNALTTAQITGASESVIKTQVASAITSLSAAWNAANP